MCVPGTRHRNCRIPSGPSSEHVLALLRRRLYREVALLVPGSCCSSHLQLATASDRIPSRSTRPVRLSNCQFGVCCSLAETLQVTSRLPRMAFLGKMTRLPRAPIVRRSRPQLVECHDRLEINAAPGTPAGHPECVSPAAYHEVYLTRYGLVSTSGAGAGA